MANKPTQAAYNNSIISRDKAPRRWVLILADNVLQIVPVTKQVKTPTNNVNGGFDERLAATTIGSKNASDCPIIVLTLKRAGFWHAATGVPLFNALRSFEQATTSFSARSKMRLFRLSHSKHCVIEV